MLGSLFLRDHLSQKLGSRQLCSRLPEGWSKKVDCSRSPNSLAPKRDHEKVSHRACVCCEPVCALGPPGMSWVPQTRYPNLRDIDFIPHFTAGDTEMERGKSNQEPGSVLSSAPALSTIPSFPKPEFKLPGGIPPCQELGGAVVLRVGLTQPCNPAAAGPGAESSTSDPR